MDATERRRAVRREIESAEAAVSANALAARLGVSRQVIVGDVALLRAEGCAIVSTARGYLGGDRLFKGRFLGRIACRHGAERTRDELYAIVDLGGQVVNVAIEHAIYGEITGQLGLMCRADVDEFCEKLRAGRAMPLSALTDGVHVHAISCPDEAAFERIEAALAEKNFLAPQQEDA